MVRVEADIFTDGHDAISGVLMFRHQNSSAWSEQPIQFDVNDRWWAEFAVSEIGRYRYTLEAWVDHFETWRRDLVKRINADQDTPIDYVIGADSSKALSRERPARMRSHFRSRKHSFAPLALLPTNALVPPAMPWAG